MWCRVEGASDLTDQRRDRPRVPAPGPGGLLPLHVPSSAFNEQRGPVSVPLAAGAFSSLRGPQVSVCPAL